MTIKMIKKDAITGTIEKQVNSFIAKGGALAHPEEHESDHRLTLRIPQWLLKKIDTKRKERVGTISRNLWILEALEKEIKCD